VRQVTRNARYLDATYTPLQNFALSKTKKDTLAVTYRHERVDPLFRSVAAFTQADRQQNHLELVAAVGDITAAVSHLRFNDNLGNLPSILTTLGRRTNLILGVPLVSLLGNPAKPSPWLPRLSYSLDEVRQFGASIPTNGGFELNLTTIPDQLSTNQNLSAEWQLKGLRFGYRFNRSFQDNRQVGRERADLRNLVNGFALGVNPTAALDLNFDVGAESASNKENDRVDRTLRIGSNITWRLTQKMTVGATLSGTAAGDTNRVSKNRSAEIDLQWSYRFGLQKKNCLEKFQGQFFIRYANRYAHGQDSLFQLDNLTRLQTLNAGVSVTFF
jgi:hypothetical protein